jgi:hypothetical protein
MSSSPTMTKTPKLACSSRALAVIAIVFVAACHRSSAAGADGGVDASDAVGVAQCDQYLADYESCIAAHVPDDRKKALTEQVARNRAAWRSMAADPGARPGLPQACLLARETARTATRAYGCTW